MKKLITLSFILILPFLAFSGKIPTKKMKYGKIPMEEFKMTTCELDSTADAVVLGDFRRYSMDWVPHVGFQISVNVYRRIKVLNNDGVDKVSRFVISLYNHNGTKEKISAFKASTFNLVDGKVEETKMDKKSKFVEDNDYYTTYKYFFKNVKAGSILEYRYAITSDFVSDFPTYYPQEEIPVLWSELFVEYYEQIDFKYFMSGGVPVFFNNHNLINGRVSDLWIFKNVPAIEQEAFMRPVKNYTARIDYELLKVAFEGAYYKDYTTSWQKISSNLMKSDRLGVLLTKKHYFKDIVAHVLADSSAKTEMDKVKSALIYIRSNYQWNDYQTFYPSLHFADVIKEKKGNSADMNMLLMGTLKSLGISTKPAVLCTRNNGVILEIKPSTDDLNYLISNFYIDGKRHFVDVATDYSGIDALPKKCLNGKALVLDKTAARWVNLETNVKYARKVFVQASMDEDFAISGSYQSKEIGYATQRIRRKIIEKGSTENYIQEIINNENNVKLEEVSLNNVDVLNKDVVLKYKFSSENLVNEMDDLITFEPIIFRDFDENPFKKEIRKFPIDFIYPISLEYTYVIQLPQGFTVQELPKPTRVSNSDKSISFLLNSVARGNSITMSLKFKINKAFYMTSQYEELKSFFDYFIDNQKQIVVIKAE